MELEELEKEMLKMAALQNQLTFSISTLLESKLVLSDKILFLSQTIQEIQKHIGAHQDFMMKMLSAEETTKRHISYVFRLMPTILLTLLVFMVFGDDIGALQIAKTIHDAIMSVF